MSENFIGTVRVLTAEEAKKRRGNTLIQLQENIMVLAARESFLENGVVYSLRTEEEVAVAEEFVEWLKGLGYAVVATKVMTYSTAVNGVAQEGYSLTVSWGSDL